MAFEPNSNPEKYKVRNALANKASASRFLIEGESVTFQEIADKVGCTIDQAIKRHRREIKKDGPITWAGLSV